MKQKLIKLEATTKLVRTNLTGVLLCFGIITILGCSSNHHLIDPSNLNWPISGEDSTYLSIAKPWIDRDDQKYINEFDLWIDRNILNNQIIMNSTSLTGFQIQKGLDSSQVPYYLMWPTFSGATPNDIPYVSLSYSRSCVCQPCCGYSQNDSPINRTITSTNARTYLQNAQPPGTNNPYYWISIGLFKRLVNQKYNGQVATGINIKNGVKFELGDYQTILAFPYFAGIITYDSPSMVIYELRTRTSITPLIHR